MDNKKDFDAYETVVNKKFNLENAIIKNFQDIKKLRGERIALKNRLSMAECELREIFGKLRIKRDMLK